MVNANGYINGWFNGLWFIYWLMSCLV